MQCWRGAEISRRRFFLKYVRVLAKAARGAGVSEFQSLARIYEFPSPYVVMRIASTRPWQIQFQPQGHP